MIVLVDYKKAFDRINHDLLLRKLGNLQVNPTLVNWIRLERSSIKESKELKSIK